MNWIDIRDKIPNEGEEVLVRIKTIYKPKYSISYIEEITYEVRARDKEHRYINGYSGFYISQNDITHWARISPPKGYKK